MKLSEIICRNSLYIISLIFLLFLCLSNKSFDKKSTLYFIAALITTAILIIVESLDVYFSYSEWEYSYIARNIACFFKISLSPLIPLFILFVTYYKLKKRFAFIPFAVSLVFCFINLFTGFMFYVSPENIMTKTIYFAIPLEMSAIYLIGIVGVYLKYYKKARKSEMVFVSFICIMAFVSAMIQVFCKIPFLVLSYCSIALVFYYLFLTIQIFKIDSLTLTQNRNVFENEFCFTNNGEKGVILVFDLNNLKHVNDEMGHTKGDEFLIYTAMLIKQCFEEMGNIYRIGGDEFAVICKDYTTTDILPAIAKFRSALSKTNYNVAVGFTEYNDIIKKKTAFKLADDAMYENKHYLKSIDKIFCLNKE